MIALITVIGDRHVDVRKSGTRRSMEDAIVLITAPTSEMTKNPQILIRKMSLAVIIQEIREWDETSGIDHLVETVASVAKWRHKEANHPSICRRTLDRPVEADRGRWQGSSLDRDRGRHDRSHLPDQERPVDRIIQNDRALDHLCLLRGPMTSSVPQSQTVLAQAGREILETIVPHHRLGSVEQGVLQSWGKRVTSQVSDIEYRILLIPLWKRDCSRQPFIPTCQKFKKDLFCIV